MSTTDFSLEQIDPDYFSETLPQARDAVDALDAAARRSNLHQVHQSLVAFLEHDCGKKLPASHHTPNLRSITESGSEHEIVKLLKLLLLAAISCDQRNIYIEDIQKIQAGTLAVLVPIIQDMSQGDAESEGSESIGSPDLPPQRNSALATADSVLEAEERQAQLVSENKQVLLQLRQAKDDLYERDGTISRLRQDKDAVVEELETAKGRIANLLTGDGSRARATETKHATELADLELRCRAFEEQNEALHLEVETLQQTAKKSQRLQDDHDEMKAKVKSLTDRANAGDKYKAKLETSKDFENEAKNLRSQNERLKQQVLDGDSLLNDRNRTMEENKTLIRNLEQQHVTYSEQLQRFQDRHLEDQDTMRRIKAGDPEMLNDEQDEDQRTPTTPTPEARNGDVLADFDDHFTEDEARLSAGISTSQGDDRNWISEEEFDTIMRILQAKSKSETSLGSATGEEEQRRLAAKLQNDRSLTRALIQHIRKQSLLIASLRSDRGAASPSAMPVLDVSESEILARTTPSTPIDSSFEERLEKELHEKANLQLELRLMQSAWYKLHHRLFGSGVATKRGRGPPEPKGFLGRQRRALEEVMIGKSAP